MEEQPNFAPPHNLRSPLQGHVAAVSYAPENGLLATFIEQPLYMEYLSKTVGHPIYQGRIYTRLVAPGNTKTVWFHETKGIRYELAIDPESGEYHSRWEVMEQCENGDRPEPELYPKAWRAFERKGIMADTGWAIEEWGAITRSYAESLKAQNIHTVEALRDLTDRDAQNIMGGIKYRDLARASLDERERNRMMSREQERASRAEEENKALNAKIEGLTQLLGQLQAQIEGGHTLPNTRLASAQDAVAPGLAAFNATQAQAIPRASARKSRRGMPPGPETGQAA